MIQAGEMKIQDAHHLPGNKIFEYAYISFWEYH